jgi:hypothetical protein
MVLRYVPEQVVQYRGRLVRVKLDDPGGERAVHEQRFPSRHRMCANHRTIPRAVRQRYLLWYSQKSLLNCT